MRILLLAPHPFYQERGTPIAVNLLLSVLSGRGDTVDVVTFHEGADVTYPGVTLHRIRPPRGVRNVPPGFSWKKIVCDRRLAALAADLARTQAYDLVHAVEESAFIAMMLRRRFGLPYVYDMDSSVARQMVEKFPVLTLVRPLLTRIEGAAVRRAAAVIAVCDRLAEIARREGAHHVHVLRDISLLGAATAPCDPLPPKTRPDQVRFLYVGNLERYQGIDLLLESTRLAAREQADIEVMIVGGTPAAIARYRRRAGQLGVADRVVFAGPRPVQSLATVVASADVLVSPRLRGINTPMKVYSYLDAGKAILATDLPTHTQVLTPDVAELAPPEAAAFAHAMVRLASDRNRRERMGSRARDLAQREHSLRSFGEQANRIYDAIAAEQQSVSAHAWRRG